MPAQRHAVPRRARSRRTSGRGRPWRSPDPREPARQGVQRARQVDRPSRSRPPRRPDRTARSPARSSDATERSARAAPRSRTTARRCRERIAEGASGSTRKREAAGRSQLAGERPHLLDRVDDRVVLADRVGRRRELHHERPESQPREQLEAALRATRRDSAAPRGRTRPGRRSRMRASSRLCRASSAWSSSPSR